MKRQSFVRRVVALCLLMVMVTGTLTMRLVYLQIVRGEDIAAGVTDNTVRKYTQLASRGEILDRDGNKLVSNTKAFFLQLDYFNWDKSRQNEVLLDLAQRLYDADIETHDNLPISFEAPFSYTYTSTESGVGRKLIRFLDKQGWDKTLPAGQILSLLCNRYDIPEDWTPHQQRLVAGFRYYLEDCEFSSYNTPVTLAEDLDIDTVASLSEDSKLLPGISITVDDIRQYNTTLAAHILGRVAAISAEEYAQLKDKGYSINDTLGKDGIEKALEEHLRGIDGTYAVEYDRNGAVVDQYFLEDPDPGNNVVLTLDMMLQAAAERALEQTLNDLRANKKKGEGGDAEGGCAVVIDVKTGEILALANWPTYNLETFSADFAANNSNPLAPLFNRCISALYSPGSTFKMCTSVAALEEGIITPKTQIRDTGIYTYYEDYQPRCWIYRQHGRTHGLINVSQALKYSCNCFYYEVGRLMGNQTLAGYAAAFGLGQKTGIELTGEKAGHMASAAHREQTGGSPWYAGDTLQAAIGQSDTQFTPIQLANYVATLVNGGTRYQPHLVKRITNNTGDAVVQDITPTILNTVEMSAATVKAVKEGMKGVVTEDGTASSYFKGFPIQVGGKTGSAQNTGGRSAHGLFVSFAPYDDPEIAVCVVGEYAGSGGALAPVCLEIYREYFGLVTPEDTDAQQPAA